VFIDPSAVEISTSRSCISFSTQLKSDLHRRNAADRGARKSPRDRLCSLAEA